MELLFLRCLATALIRHGAEALEQQLALADFLGPIADSALLDWRNLRPNSAERRADQQAILELSLEGARRASLQIAQELAPPVIRDAVSRYLECLPGVLRRACRPGVSLTGKAVPAPTLDDLLSLLPVRAPRFRPGAHPPGDSTLVLRELIGMGGFGEVWKATHTARPNDPPLAVKFCLDPQSRRRLFQHDATLNRLVSQQGLRGVVKLERSSLEAEIPWLAFEYVEGSDLAYAIRAAAGDPAPERLQASLPIMHELAGIVAGLHAMKGGVVHRDLKPANILVERTAQGSALRITDFGIGGVTSQSELNHSERGGITVTALRGTMSQFYSPPEQRTGADASPRDDVHALGVIWYHMLTGNLGRDPGTAPDETLEDLGTPREVSSLILSCFKKRDKRLADAGLLAAKIAALLPNLLGMKFVRIPKGSFWMSKNDKNAQRQVEIPHDFELGVDPVTQAQWQAVMGNNPSYFSRTGDGKDEVKAIADADLKQFPVENVSWDDAQQFIVTLNEKERGSGFLYRLPTEAEWEYACREGAHGKADCSFDFSLEQPSNDLSSTQANFNGNKPGGSAAKGPYLERTTKVGSYPGNRLGLCDMHGNVWELCQDLYEEGGSRRVSRGGGWSNGGQNCRAASRLMVVPSFRNDSLGLRLARVPVR